MSKVRWSGAIPASLVLLFVACNQGRFGNDRVAIPNVSPSEAERRNDLKEFLNCQVIPRLGNPWDYTFEPGKFPRLEWDRPQLVEKVMGRFDLKARWFDAQLNEVSTPNDPGRYAFYVEGETPAGDVIRRAYTVYCRPRSWFGWSEKPKAYLDFIPVDGIDPVVWQQHEGAIATFSGRMILLSILSQQRGAILMSYLHEMKAAENDPPLTDTPIIRDHDYHLALKRRILVSRDIRILPKEPNALRKNPG